MFEREDLITADIQHLQQEHHDALVQEIGYRAVQTTHGSRSLSWLVNILFGSAVCSVAILFTVRAADSRPSSAPLHGSAFSSSESSAMRMPSMASPRMIRRAAFFASASSASAAFSDAVARPEDSSASSSRSRRAILKRMRKAPQGYFASSVRSAVIDANTAMYLPASIAANVDRVRATLDRTSALGGTAIVIEVKAGRVFYPTTSTLALDYNLVRPIQDIPAIVAMAKERGMQVIARFVAANDPGLASAIPQTQIRHPKTGRSVGSVWIDPSHPTVIEYNRQILKDLLLMGIDEVNLDYIRYPTEYAQAGIGLTGKEKADRVEAFVQMARDTVNEISPTTRLGLSTYAILGWDYPINLEALGQDVVRFAPFVDIISPMAYPSTFTSPEYYVAGKHPRTRPYYLVYRTLEGYEKLLGPEHAHKIRPWIQGYGFTQHDMSEQMDAVYDAGYCGFMVWNAKGNHDPAYAALGSNKNQPKTCRGIEN